MSDTGSFATIQDFWRALLPAARADQPCVYTRYRERFRPCSYKELNAQAHCAASYLMDQGLLKGQKVGLFTPPHLSAMVLDLALQYVGAIGVHLPGTLSTQEVEHIAQRENFQFLFVGDHATYLEHQEFAGLKPQLKGILLETEDAEGLSPESLITFDIVVLRGKSVWREQMEVVNDMKSAVKSSDIYALFPKSPDTPTDYRTVTFQQVLNDLGQAREQIAEQKSTNVVATTPEERYLHHIYGSFAPIAAGSPLYLISPENLSAEIAGDIKPSRLVGTPHDIEKMYQRLPEHFLGKPAQADLDKAQALIDIREEAAEAGKKPPFMKNMKYKTHNLRLYKQVRKKLGGQLHAIVCDYQEPEHKISRFMRECGIEIQVMEQP